MSSRGAPAVVWTLRLRQATCLERCLILQRWSWAHGVRRTVVIGAGSEDGVIGAHAWLDGEDDNGHLELTRLDLPPVAP